MTTSHETSFKAFIVGATTVAAYVRVKVDALELITVAAAADVAIGVTTEARAAGLPCTVRLAASTGTTLMTAAGVIAAGAQLFPAAAGRVAAAGTTAIPFVALEAATAAGDVIECSVGMKGA